MKLEKKYLNKYLHQAAIDQLRDEYSKRGYLVRLEFNVGRYISDLFVEGNNEKILIEVKAGRLDDQKREAIKRIAAYVNSHPNYKFQIAHVPIPEEKQIDIHGFDILVSNYLNENLPSAIDELSSHSRIEDVFDIEIDEITVNQVGLIEVTGSCSVEVDLQFGSDSDQENDHGLKMSDRFPMTFCFLLASKEGQLEIIEERKVKIDISNYYE